MPKTDSTQKTVGWNGINWRKAEVATFKLQKRIYQASKQGDERKVRKLQKTLSNSYYAKVLAIRRVTQDNQGKKTAGIDGVKNLVPAERLQMVKELKITGKAKPVRRVYIPKRNGEKRPLGIPVMRDRALQALCKLVLEPAWEARFEVNSYGFRPGRSTHDAIQAIYTAINQKSKYVLDADIAKCFDRINHKALLEKLNTYPKLRRQIRAWLEAGCIIEDELFPTKEGSPQGGVISPLLANIALHGMENHIKEFARSLKGKKDRNAQALTMVRYADDFVILHENLEIVEACKELIEQFLRGLGLELKPSKTRIAHTLKKHQEQEAGFNFLGFNIRQYPVSKNHSGSSSRGCERQIRLYTFRQIRFYTFRQRGLQFCAN